MYINFLLVFVQNLKHPFFTFYLALYIYFKNIIALENVIPLLYELSIKANLYRIVFSMVNSNETNKF